MNCWDRYNHIDRGEVSFTVRGDGSGDTCPVVYGFSHSNSNTSMGTKSQEETAMTLRTVPTGEGAIIQSLGFKGGQSANGGLGDEPEVSPTLPHQPSALEPTVCCNGPQAHSTTRGYGVDIAPTIGAAAGDSGDNKPFVAIQSLLAAMRYIVRRLTPTECERLQGLPDNYTIPVGLRRFFDANGEPSPALVAEFQRIFDTYGAIMADYAHKPAPKPKSAKQVAAWLANISAPATCPDSPRYKACGNGWATNQPRWLVLRILNQEGVEW